jgi:hypothetical protein
VVVHDQLYSVLCEDSAKQLEISLTESDCFNVHLY